jgi:hypothetical protein
VGALLPRTSDEIKHYFSAEKIVFTLTRQRAALSSIGD